MLWYSVCSNDKADLILINTCSVREKPVNKLFSELGEFKKKRKTLIRYFIAKQK